MRYLGKHLLFPFHVEQPRRWLATSRGLVLGLFAAFGILAARWLRKSPKIERQATLELDLTDLMPVGSAAPPLPRRDDPRIASNLIPPDVAAFEVH